METKKVLKRKLQLEIIRSRPLSPDARLLTLALAPDLATACRPGQFFNLRPADAAFTTPLLPRPISICDARAGAGEIDFLIQTIGAGTRLLTLCREGDYLDVIGPLGSSFKADAERPAFMLAGGVGVAPLLFLARWLRRRRTEAGVSPETAPPVTFCYGARDKSRFVLLKELAEEADALVLATEDGSMGVKGFVTDAARSHERLNAEAQIFICGPTPMMNAALGVLREKGLEGQISLENQMACGVGACQGCVVESRAGYLRVCCDGPVVSSEAFERLGGE